MSNQTFWMCANCRKPTALDYRCFESLPPAPTMPGTSSSLSQVWQLRCMVRYLHKALPKSEFPAACHNGAKFKSWFAAELTPLGFQYFIAGLQYERSCSRSTPGYCLLPWFPEICFATGVYNETVWRGLDYVLAQASNYNLKVSKYHI